MPINQYSEDPEALTTIDLDEAAKNFKKREERTGKPAMDQGQIARAIGIDISGSPEQANPAPVPTSGPIDIRKAAADATQKTAEIAQAPTQVNNRSYKDDVWALYQHGDMTPGEAVGWWQKLYEAGDPSIKSAAGADEFARRLPGWGSKFADQALLAFGKPIANVLETAGGMIGKENLDAIGKYIPTVGNLGDLASGNATRAIEAAQAQEIPLRTTRPQSYIGAFANATYNDLPSIVGTLPEWRLAEKGAAGLLMSGLARLPRYAESIGEVANITQRARLGKALIEPSEAIADRFAQAKLIAAVGGNLAASAGLSAASNQDWKANLALTAGLFGMGLGIMGAGKFIGTRAGWYEPKNLGKIHNYISEKTGIPASTLAKDMDHFGQVYSALKTMNAPDSVMKTFLDGVPGQMWNKTIGKEFGRYLSEADETTADGMQRVLNLLPDNAQTIVRDTWEKYNKLKATKAQWQEDLGGTVPPPKPEPINTVPVHPVSEDLNGASLFRSPDSKIGLGTTTTRTVEQVLRSATGTRGYAILNDGTKLVMNSLRSVDEKGRVSMGDGTDRHISSIKDVLDFNGKSKLTGPASINRPFKNPAIVNFDPTKETWAEATIRQLSPLQSYGKQALYLLNRYKLTPQEYAAVSNELAIRTAKKAGHGSIFAQGTGPNDKVFVDLLTHNGGTVNEVADRIEAGANKKALSFFKNYPSVILPVAGAGALLAGQAANPPESKAADYGALVEDVTKGLSHPLVKYGVPIAIGYGLTPSKSDAAMDPGPLMELITKTLGDVKLRPTDTFSREIGDLIDQLGPEASRPAENSVGNLVAKIQQESPTTAYLFENIVNRRSAITGETDLPGAIKDYSRVLDSLKEPLEIRPSFGDDAIPTTHIGRQVYHGTPAAFDEFDPNRVDPKGLYGPGTYVTSDPEVASGYARTKRLAVGGQPTEEGIPRPNLRPMKIREDTNFLDMEDNIPMKLGRDWKATLGEISSSHDDLEYVDDMMTRGAPMSELYGAMVQRGFSKAKLNKMVAEDGYDGITHIGGRGDKSHHRVWILFNPKDLETAHGLAATPTQAWARAIWEPTAEQELARHTFPPDENGPWHTIGMDQIQAMREKRADTRKLETFKTPGQYGAGWDQAPGRSGATYQNIQKRQDSGVLEYEIGHDLAGKISRIGGYIDPVDHHWYVQEKEAADWGLGKKALDSLVQGGIASGFIKGIKTNYTPLVLAAAATGLIGLMGTSQANAAEMPPWTKLLGSGVKGMGVVDELARTMGQATTPEAVNAAANGARELAKSRLPDSFTDSAEALFAAGDTAPEKAFGPEFRDIFGLMHDPSNEFLTTGSDALKNPAYAIEDPLQVWDRGHADYILRQEEMLTGINSLAQKGIDSLDEIFGNTKLDIDQILHAADGLENDPVTGAIRQLKPDAIPEATEIATKLKETIDDPIFKLYHGIDPRVPSILKSLGLPEKEETYHLLRWLQDIDITQGTPNWNGRKVKAVEIMAAEKTKGMLKYQPWHNLDTATSKQGILSKFPLANEQAQLQLEVKRISDLYPNGMPPEQGKVLKAATDRLTQIKIQQDQMNLRKTADLNRLGKSHYWGPRMESKELGLRIGLENDPRKIMGHYIHGALGQVFFNEMIYKFRGLATFYDAMGQNNAANYVRRYINTQRGMRSLIEDNYIVSRFNRMNQTLSKVIGYKPNLWTLQHVRGMARFAMQLMYLGKLALNPAFFAANLTQSLLTGAAVPFRFLAQGLVKALTDNNLEAEVAATGVLRSGSHYSAETGGVTSKLGAVADYLPTKSETFNRKLVYQAGKNYALDAIAKNKFKIQKHIAPYFDHSIMDSGKATPDQVARAYGAALVRSTQFIQGSAGRPLMFSGGVGRQMWGQFRSFQAGYGNLLWSTFKNDKPAFLRLMGSLLTLGGLGALPFGDNLKDLARTGFAAAGGDPNLIPDGSPVGKVYELLMGEESPFNITGAVTPINYQSMNPFGDAGKFVGWAGGPTAGTTLQVGKAGVDYATGKIGGSAAFTGMVKPLFPGTLGIAGLEALQETGVLDELMNQMNYRGGIYSPSGKPFTKERSATQIGLRALNMQPSVGSQRSNYKFEITKAIESQNYDRAKDLIQKAQKAGFIFNARDIGNMKSITAKQRSAGLPNQRLPK